ncbi:MAG: cupin domain-containing protein [Halanaerobiales bacterium]
MKKFSLDNYIVEPEEKVAKRVIYSDDNTLAFMLNIAPGQSLPDHTHFDCTVLLQVLRGQARVNVDEKPVLMEEKELIKIDGPETMSVDNTGQDTLVLYVTISPLPPAEKFAVDADI